MKIRIALRLVIAATFVLALGATTLRTTQAVHAAPTGVQVYVAYADSTHSAGQFPTPWYGDPGVVWQGCSGGCSTYDAGAVMVVNGSGSAITIDSVQLTIGTCTFNLWGSTVVPAGQQAIFTQTKSGAGSACPADGTLDTSDVGPNGSNYTGNCTPDGLLPTVNISINGTTTSYTDSGQVLNTGGFDLGGCPAGTSEAHSWTLVGTNCGAGSTLTLSPPTQSLVVGQTATITATYTNGCGAGIPGATVNFADQTSGGPNPNLTGTGTTNSSGVATFTYTSSLAGTDTWQASVNSLGGTISSNTVTVVWTAPFLGTGAFVIGDKSGYSNGTHVFYWGAQWWKHNSMSLGYTSGSQSFKGFAESPSNPTCGQTFTADPGNSTPPPSTVPSQMAIIVTSHVAKSGSNITGTIVHIVIISTNPGYGPNPGHAGTGTVVQQVC